MRPCILPDQLCAMVTPVPLGAPPVLSSFRAAGGDEELAEVLLRGPTMLASRPDILQDHAIARVALTRLPSISEAARRIGIPTDERHFLPHGSLYAKVDRDTQDVSGVDRRGLVIHVTSMTPGPMGSGKTLTAIGLTDGLNRLLERGTTDRRAMFALRQPSQGPTLGRKGGACGGGRSQVLPPEDINLQFTGDFAAVTQAHNAVWTALMCEAHGRRRSRDPFLERLSWTRCVDLCDRSLRRFQLAPDGRAGRGMKAVEGATVITAASEIMAILAMATDDRDLERRLGRVVLGSLPGGDTITPADLGIVGGLTVLLRLAVHPNLVQTVEGSLGFMHTGPFANIAHGNSSVIALRLARRLADYVVTEGGFGADLGAQKFHDLVSPAAQARVDLHVMVVSLRDIHHHGTGTPGPEADLEPGLANLAHHVKILEGYGTPVVITLNRFEDDPEEGLRRTASAIHERTGCPVVSHTSHRDGAEGAASLAGAVLEELGRTVVRNPPPSVPGGTIESQARNIAGRIYHAGGVRWTDEARVELELLESLHRRTGEAGALQVCMSKTPYSLSDDPALRGLPPADRPVTVTDVMLMNGAGWMTLLLGAVQRMPGMDLAGSGLRRLELRPDATSFGGRIVALREG